MNWRSICDSAVECRRAIPSVIVRYQFSATEATRCWLIFVLSANATAHPRKLPMAAVICGRLEPQRKRLQFKRVDCALRIGRVGQLIGCREGEWATEQITPSWPSIGPTKCVQSPGEGNFPTRDGGYDTLALKFVDNRTEIAGGIVAQVSTREVT